MIDLSAATDARFDSLETQIGEIDVPTDYVTDAEFNTFSGAMIDFSAATDARLDAIEEAMGETGTPVDAVTKSEFASATGTLNTSITNFSASVVNNYATSADTYAEIEALKQRVSELESELDSLTGNLSTTIEEAVKAYIVGTTNQISVNDTGTHLTIGFDENAIFGDEEDF